MRRGRAKSLSNKSTQRKSIKSLIPYFLLLGVVVTSLLSLVGNVGWNVFLELLSHFKLQYFLISLLLFSLLAITRKKQYCAALVLSPAAPQRARSLSST